MDSINYMQVLDEAHCLTCHKDYTPSKMPAGQLYCCEPRPTPCTRTCGHWYKNPCVHQFIRIADINKPDPTKPPELGRHIFGASAGCIICGEVRNVWEDGILDVKTSSHGQAENNA